MNRNTKIIAALAVLVTASLAYNSFNPPTDKEETPVAATSDSDSKLFKLHWGTENAEKAAPMFTYVEGMSPCYARSYKPVVDDDGNFYVVSGGLFVEDREPQSDFTVVEGGIGYNINSGVGRDRAASLWTRICAY